MTLPRITAGVAAVVVACAQPEPRYDPFVAPEAQVREAIEVVVATPLTHPDELHVSTAASQRIDSLVKAKLDSAGIQVVAAAEYSSIWDRILRQLGGFFDPITGERNEVKFEVARRELLRELRGRFGTDVLLYTELQIVEAVVDDGVAKWDGTSQSVTGRGARILGEFRATFQGDGFGSELFGTIDAVSLMLAIDDGDGKELYRHFGGVEVLSTSPLEGEGEGEGEGGGGGAARSYTLVADEGRVAYAVGIVAEPLSRGPSRPTPQPDGTTPHTTTPDGTTTLRHPTGR